MMINHIFFFLFIYFSLTVLLILFIIYFIINHRLFYFFLFKYFYFKFLELTSTSSSSSSSSITSHVDMVIVPIFNRKIISTFDSRAAGAGMSIAMVLDNYYKFDLISEARWLSKDSSSQSKMTKVLKHAIKDDSVLNKTLSTLYKAMPELNTDSHDTWKQKWCSASIAVEMNINSRLCAEESEYFDELK